jgi:hypothetical protein
MPHDRKRQDPFGNYVIQTAMTVAEPPQHAKLVEGIKPFLFALRNTPYGKRIQNKIMKDGPDPQQQRQRSPGGHSHPGAAAQSFPRRELSSLSYSFYAAFVCFIYHVRVRVLFIFSRSLC